MDINFHYWCEELIMSIITLASLAEKQIQIIGIGNTGDEMLIDFESSFASVKNNYESSDLFTEENIEKINEFDKYLGKAIEGQQEDFFLDRNELKNNPIWEKIRIKAKTLLHDLGMSDFDIKLSRTVSASKDDGTIVENTKRILISKK